MTHHHPSSRRACVLVTLAIASCGAMTAIAQGRDHAVVTPVHHVAGLTGGELLAESWAQRLVLPADNPFVGGCQRLGHGRQVLSPVIDANDTATCTARPGTPVFLRFGSFCDDVEPPPFFGADEAAQRACAVAADENVVALRVTVDGGPAVDIHRPSFELISPQRTVQLPPDNFVGVPAQSMTFVAHAWGAVVRGLQPGAHVIAFELAFADGAAKVTVFVNVAPGRDGRT
jgi:hypothetical protein